MKPTILAFSLLTAGVLPAYADTPATHIGKGSDSPVNTAAKTGSVQGPEDNRTYEIRGFFGADETAEVSLAKKGGTTSSWLKPGQKTGDLLIEKSDPKAGTAILKIGGVRTTVRLAGKSAESSSSGEAAGGVKRTPEELRALMKAFDDYNDALSPEQVAVMRKESKDKLEDLRLEFQMSGVKPDQDHFAKMAFVIMKDATKKAATIPDKTGKINPVPAFIDELFATSVPDLKDAFVAAARERSERMQSQSK